MKSNYRIYRPQELDRKSRDVAREELKKCSDEIYDLVSKDCSYQALATAFAVLHREFGFGKKRLNRLKEAIEDEYALMERGVMGREYSPRNAQEWLKEKYGVDFNESHYHAQGTDHEE